MAGSPRETIDRLRVHVDELMARHTALIERCECLEVRLQEREKSIAALQKELENIHAKYRSLAMAQAVPCKKAIGSRRVVDLISWCGKSTNASLS